MREVTAVLPLCAVLACGAPAAEGTAAPEYDAELVSRIGELDDPRYAFNRIGDVEVDAQGRTYVLDRGDARIRVFDRDGAHVRDFGREGSGPGEFRMPGSVGFLRDTLYATDMRLNRLTYFDTAGNVIGTVRAVERYDNPAIMPTVPSMLFANGLGVSRPNFMAESKSPVPLLLVERDGSIVDTIDLMDPSAMGLQFGDEKRMLHLSHPFAPPLLQPVSRDGKWAASVTTHPDAELRPGEFRVRLHRVGGSDAWTRTYPTEPVPYPPGKADSIITARVAQLPAGMLTEAELRSAITIPEYEYPVRAAVFAADGSALWLKLAPRPDGVAPWLVLDSAGGVQRRVRLPESFVPRLIRADTLLGTELDSLEVGSVTRYRVAPARR